MVYLPLISFYWILVYLQTFESNFHEINSALETHSYYLKLLLAKCLLLSSFILLIHSSLCWLLLFFFDIVEIVRFLFRLIFIWLIRFETKCWVDCFSDSLELTLFNVLSFSFVFPLLWLLLSRNRSFFELFFNPILLTFISCEFSFASGSTLIILFGDSKTKCHF